MNKILLVLCVLLSITACKKPENQIWDFDQIKSSGELTVITVSSSTSYFIYKDEPMGYEYDLIKDFCDHHGLRLNVKVAENPNRLLDMLLNNEGDLVITPLAIQNTMKDSVIYCGLEQISHQVLVQRNEVKDSLINNVTNLIGRDVVVTENSKYSQRLFNLNTELGGGIHIKNIDKDTVTVEDLIEMVSLHQIDFTVADDYLAKLNKTYYRNIDVSLAISFEQRSSWATRKDMPLLADSINKWFSDSTRKKTFQGTIKKYFELSKGNEPNTLFETQPNMLSPYDDLFKKYAKVSGYDWCLLAAICYQESKFKNNLSSWAGAKGLMGLMPRTAKSFGVMDDELNNPDRNIMAGASLIKRLNSIFSKIKNPDQKIKFVLAAYNGGNGHVSDAQALARKYGDDPDIWDDSVEKYIALKSNPEYYNDPVCKNGYLRSKEVLNYVDDVLSNWDKFKTQNIN